ncbi:hypothetical protein GEU84_014245 [Fertoebacter nigrum]|uniref:DnaA N-terminal domain-containing protein n=1 Tax=Fertoeibacter niger TaxID=2656921 RepID=A0A8X8H8M1_9RHOB|nr:DnaA N-terminal domain-containing protein [Fertoeibacter niger]NUB45556.1 hypothetical protein [Fertoeibacter niger]
MAVTRPVGQGASARKYDIISAIGAHGLAGDKVAQRLALRLITLITARYNWARDELAVGQREIARLWSVDERTVKREMARLRDLGWLVLRRQGARGHVSSYALNLPAILTSTQSHWAAVGSDLSDRLAGPVPAGTDLNIIPFPAPAPIAPAEGRWARISDRFRAEQPALHAAWVQPLVLESEDSDTLTLVAPSRFHGSYVRTHLLDTLQRLCRAEVPGVSALFITPL